MSHKPPDHYEDGIEIPLDQINPDTLNKMIEEFVSREWSSLTDEGYSLEEKVDEVLVQLKMRKVKVVFDFKAGTANFVVVS
jgi:uncharacterized protein YheU (UPF0270 family)